MKYIFDFDHTLFDTDFFIDAAEPYKADGLWLTPRIWDLLPVDDFLYEDTLDYLVTLSTEDCVLLTAWTSSLGPESYEFQREKVMRSKVASMVAQVIVMEGDKGMYVQELAGSQGAVFVDDTLTHLLSAQTHAPHVVPVQMMRPGCERDTSPTIPVVHSLTELASSLLP